MIEQTTSDYKLLSVFTIETEDNEQTETKIFSKENDYYLRNYHPDGRLGSTLLFEREHLPLVIEIIEKYFDSNMIENQHFSSGKDTVAIRTNYNPIVMGGRSAATATFPVDYAVSIFNSRPETIDGRFHRGSSIGASFDGARQLLEELKKLQQSIN